MCTVSYINDKGKVIITSNRDENKYRSPALAPKTYTLNDRKVIFPKDPKGGGTWFAVNDLNTVVVLLNGAQEKHSPQPFYKRSRGLVVLDLIETQDTLHVWEALDLGNIEPFTIILFHGQQLYQMRWDGIKKSITELNSTTNYIWSSSTLYSKEVQQQKQKAFTAFLKQEKNIDQLGILEFHSLSKFENTANGLPLMNKSELMTVNITQVILKDSSLTMKHLDVINDQKSCNTSPFVL
jgi:uncharacterized protein with NRDE domain